MSRILQVLLIGILALFGLSACSTPPPVPDDSYFRLQQSQPRKRFSEPVLPGILLIETPEAAGVRRSRKIIYSEDQGHLRFQQYHYHHWEDSPPNLIQRHLTEVLSASGVASAAVDRRKGSIQYVLESRIERFDRLLSGGGAISHIEFEIWLIDLEDPDRILLHRHYEEKVTASSMTMETTVVAFSKGLELIFKRLLEDLGRLES